MSPLATLIAANVAFVGSHFAMSHPLRAAMLRLLGERGFPGVYSLVSLALVWWVSEAFKAAGAGGILLWNGAATGPWLVASLLTILAMVLLIGSLKGNPALSGAEAHALERAEASGALAVTRHPMMWAFALWAIAHIIAWPSPRTLVTALAMGTLALLGAHMQDRKKERLLGAAWAQWEARTSYWPRPGRLPCIAWPVWIAGLIAWLAATWLHLWIAGIPAGSWRWMG